MLSVEAGRQDEGARFRVEDGPSVHVAGGEAWVEEEGLLCRMGEYGGCV